MTPKEKAKELVVRFRQLPPNSPWTGIGNGEAKQCALIAVELLIDTLHEMKLIFSDREIIYKYWKEVKNEIEKL